MRAHSTMTMRGSARRAIAVDVRKFGWDRAAFAALRHSTLPWHDQRAPEITLDAAPLTALKDLGSRDRLSLVGQFAAHLAFLQFAGIRDGDFDPNQWAVVRKRATDCRLVRVFANHSAEDSPPVLTVIQQFTAGIGAPPLDVLRQSWGRAETVYQEIESRLRADAAADLRWLRRSTLGWVTSPGLEMLRELLTRSRGKFSAPTDLAAFRALAAVDAAISILGDEASPVDRYSGIRTLGQIVGTLDPLAEREIVERVVGALGESHRIFVLADSDSLDQASRRVIDVLQAADVGVWIGVEGQELPETRWFLLSPRLDARRDVESRLTTIPSNSRRRWLEELAESTALNHYLDDGTLPAAVDSGVRNLREPLRSYIAAVALLGPRASKALVDRFLERLMSTARAADLVIEGITALDDGQFAFLSDEIHRQAIDAIPATSRASLSRVAAEVAEAYGDRRCAAFLFLESGDHTRAAAHLESIEWHSPRDVIRTLRSLPRSALSQRLSQVLAEAQIACGRYRDAKEIASDLLLARIERRLGDYALALSRLERLDTADFEAELLRAEILRLLDRHEEARKLLDDLDASTDDERVRLGYQRAVLANETGAPSDDAWMRIDTPCRDYYVARISVYRAVAAHDLQTGIVSARAAIATAASIPDRVDATLDLLFALFCSGDWIAARAAALDGLLLVDQTQGDRAAGGILFMLAYLCADDGQWVHAEHLLDRLRKFYGDMHDEKRLGELDMLAAAIDFSRGRFDAAERSASVVLQAATSDQIHETAALMLDEIDWIKHRQLPLRSTGKTANVELTNRHALLRARRGLVHDQLRGFPSRLFEWEEARGAAPTPGNGSEKLMLFRAALGRERAEVAKKIAAELNISVELEAPAGESELRILRAVAALPYPFAQHDFSPTPWRYATRNRLGQWLEIGALPPLPSAELDAILAAPPTDWVTCSDRELLYISGLSRWSSVSREAIASLFRIRAEHYRLRRLMDDEPVSAVGERVEGIVGESPAIREVYELIFRLAKRDVAVCVLGESGTGKELVARAIHRQSSRRHKPFMAINCAALPENLFESELFGHARGAFTGADRDRAGLIETTDGGTLFLDEIGEMPVGAQAKLLRFLQEGEFRRVGETTHRTADVRVVTATNRKLEAAVEQGRFREDLYYRIRGVEIMLPPLRDRASDIPLLAAHFLTVERQKHRGGAMRLSGEVEAAFVSYHWPGNVRELQNTIRAAHALAGEAREIDLEHLPERLRRIKIVRMPLGSYQDAVARFRRELIEKSLAQANGNQNQAAAMLKISRQALAYQIRELGILVTPSKRPHG